MMGLLQLLAGAWLYLLPLLLGYIALWALMPPARQGRIVSSTLIGFLSLLLAGFVLPQATGVRTPLAFTLLFYIFAGLAVAAGATMIVQRNPVYAALWFAVVILSVCGLFLLQSAPFLAAATIIIYAGAIIVTFLFVIMLAQQSGLAEYDRRSREPALALFAGFLLMGGLLWCLQITYASASSLPRMAAELRKGLDLLADNSEAQAKDVADLLRFQNDPLDHILLEEAKHLPPWPRQQPIRQELVRLGAAVGSAIQTQNKPALLEAVKEYLRLIDELDRAQNQLTGVAPVPPEKLRELSTLSIRENNGKYVAGLGRTLFGDDLYAVAASAVLLLAATIGAIIIAQRKAGESA